MREYCLRKKIELYPLYFTRTHTYICACLIHSYYKNIIFLFVFLFSKEYICTQTHGTWLPWKKIFIVLFLVIRIKQLRGGSSSSSSSINNNNNNNSNTLNTVEKENTLKTYQIWHLNRSETKQQQKNLHVHHFSPHSFAFILSTKSDVNTNTSKPEEEKSFPLFRTFCWIPILIS